MFPMLCLHLQKSSGIRKRLIKNIIFQIINGKALQRLTLKILNNKVFRNYTRIIILLDRDGISRACYIGNRVFLLYFGPI